MKNGQIRTLQLLAAGLATLLVYLVAWQAYDQLGAWQYALYAGGVLLAWTCWSLSQPVARRTPGLSAEGEQLEEALEQQQESLEHLAQQLNRREQLLTNKLVTFREWMEFPEPLDLNRPVPEEPPEELADLVARDREMIQLLEGETERIFNAILKKKYDDGNTFQPGLLWEEIYQLANNVARIYHPNANTKFPLLETSAEQVLVASSRIALQMLVVIDQLPLNVKQMNISSLYSYVSKGVQAYGIYKTAQPFLSIASNAFYVGRFALGTNPAGLGAWWLLQKLGKRTADSIGGRYLNRQALGLLQSLVRAVGFEVAQLYGPDFRYRDANWIYATEVAEVIASLPSAEGNLALAFQEVGSLQLRSEYDRVYLYRALAAGRSCQPEQYHALQLLDDEQREELVERLIAFADSFGANAAQDERDQWQQQMAARLGTSRQLAGQEFPPDEEQLALAVTALGTFLMHHKHLAADELAAQLKSTTLLDQRQLDMELLPIEASEFQLPNLDPAGGCAELFLDSLLQLQVSLAPRGTGDEAVMATAAKLGLPTEHLRGRLDAAYQQQLSGISSVELPARIPTNVALLLLDGLSQDEQIQLVFPVVSVQWQADEQLSLERHDCWLIGSDQRLLVLAGQHRGGLIWQSEQPVELSREGGWLKNQCWVSGGELVAEESPTAARILLGGELLSGFEIAFQPLVDWNESRSG